MDHGAGQMVHVLAQFGQVVEDGPRVQGIEHQQVDHRVAVGLHGIAAPMGHGAVGHLHREVEGALGRLRVGEVGQHGGCGHGPLQRPADGQEPPAHRVIHVLVNEAGEAIDLAEQNPHRPRGVVADLHPLG